MTRRVAALVGLLALIAVSCSDDDSLSYGNESSTGQDPVAAAGRSDTPAPTASVEPPGGSETLEARETTTGDDRPSDEPSSEDERTSELVSDDTGSSTRDEYGGENLGPLGSSVRELDTGDGQIQIGSGSVPEVASELPIPDGLVIQLSSVVGDDAGFSGTVPDSVAVVADFYRFALPGAGFTIERDEPVGSVVLFGFTSDDASGEIAVSEAPGGGATTVTVTFTAIP